MSGVSLSRVLRCTLPAVVLAGGWLLGGPDSVRAGGSGPSGASAVSCPVSTPNGGRPEGGTGPRWFHGSGGLWTVLWPGGTAPISPDQVRPDGWLRLKTPWWRAGQSFGKVKVQGWRLDGPAPGLRADVPAGYGRQGFQASLLIFPVPGCWEVTAQAGGGSITFVERVVRTHH